MILHDISVYGTPGKKHLYITGGIIRQIAATRNELKGIRNTRHLELDGCIALPGFINSHDHLDFNCYPACGNGQYKNYTVWGPDIQQTHAGIIAEVKKIPLPLRIQWGLYKNLLGGFTTVVNHGEKLDTRDELISVQQDHYALHSPSFEKNWAWKLNKPFRNKRPFVMHIGEGTDAAAHDEINSVIRKNYLKRKIIAIHGVAMDEKQATAFEGLVWCPASNDFLLGATAPVQSLKKKMNIVFGTDSTLTAPWGSDAHFDIALASGQVTEEELTAMLTLNAARLWKLKDRGELKEGMRADIVVLKQHHQLFTRFTDNLQMVICGGEPSVSAIPPENPVDSDRILLNEKVFFVKKGIRDLFSAIRDRYKQFTSPFAFE